MLVNDILQCSFSNWYHNFEKSTFESVILPIPSNVKDYLLQDGIVLPEGSSSKCTYDTNSSDGDSDDSTDWNDATLSSTASGGNLEVVSFPEFDLQISNAIRNLGGGVFPKLNWSSPKDASWIGLNNSLSCHCPADVYMLLKSSDFVTHDLTKPFKNCDDCTEHNEKNLQYYLVLRRWHDINPGMEFRCFVWNKDIIGISQRDDVNYYSYIAMEKDAIVDDIVEFFDENIAELFCLNNYVFDVVRNHQGHVSVVDFNPFGQTTDSLLFSWEELLEKTGDLQFRCVETNIGVQPHPYRHYRYPVDIVEGYPLGQDAANLASFLQSSEMQKKPNVMTEEDKIDIVSSII